MPMDALVVVGFVGSGLALRMAPTPLRVLWILVGATWWLGDVPAFRLMHQGVLIVALGCFPAGRPHTFAQRATVVIGLALAPGFLGQPGAAIGFLAAAGLGFRRGAFVQLSAAGIGLWLAASFVWSRAWPGTFDPSLALFVYELLMFVVALALPWGLWADARQRLALSDRVLAMGPAGLSGLEAALRRTLGRHTLHLARPRRPRGRGGPGRNRRRDGGGGQQVD